MELLESIQKLAEEENPMCHAATHQCVLLLDGARDFICKENLCSDASPLKEASCPLHEGEQRKVYDSTCRKAVCSICALLPEHRGGSLQFLNSPLITSPLLSCSIRP
jgi:hypothetical protein